jgi:hypothetical protein
MGFYNSSATDANMSAMVKFFSLKGLATAATENGFEILWTDLESFIESGNSKNLYLLEIRLFFKDHSCRYYLLYKHSPCNLKSSSTYRRSTEFNLPVES